MKKIKIIPILFLSLLQFTTLNVFPQDATQITPFLSFKTFKNTEDQRFLQTTLTYSKNSMELPLSGVSVTFFNGGDTKESLATVVTDSKGVAEFELKNDLKLKSDNTGMWTFSTEFKGNDSIAGGTSEVTVKDVRLKMVLSVTDTIRTVTLTAVTDVNGNEKPVTGEVVKVYVPRMFSMLTIGELTLDAAGTASVEFPADLPGDKEGNLTVIAKFEENATYGDVEKRETLKWGTPTDYSVPVSHRALWTKTAPKWMIYTLSVLLAGVWGHYLFALISLIRIKIDAKRTA